jgi:hypothetical protein
MQDLGIYRDLLACHLETISLDSVRKGEASFTALCIAGGLWKNSHCFVTVEVLTYDVTFTMPSRKLCLMDRLGLLGRML